MQSEVGQHRGYEYSRSGNPTRTALETCLAALEGGRTGLAFASGLAAEDCLLRTVARPGAHVVIPDDAYGGTYRLFAKVLERWGVSHTPVPLGDLAAVSAAMRPETVLVWCETPTNPLLSVSDIAGLAEVAHAGGARLVVDNTFASPYLQQPLALGADVVVHSTTKYLGGHSDVVGGALVAADVALGEELAYHQNALGGVGRGLRLLAGAARREDARRPDGPALRERRQGRRPAAGAPGGRVRALPRACPSTPGTRSRRKQMRQFGGMVSFRLAGGEQAALRRLPGARRCSRWRSRSAASSRSSSTRAG